MNAQDESGETALTKAVQLDGLTSVILITTLLGLGARVAHEDPRSAFGTSVHRAARGGDVIVLKHLLDADGRVALSQFNDLGDSPLICAIRAKSADAVRLLIDSGAALNLRDEQTLSDPPLTHAVREQDVELVILLLQAGASPHTPGWMQVSPLEHACDQDDENPTETSRRIRSLLEEKGVMDPAAPK